MLFVICLLQSSPEIFRSVFPEFLFQCGQTGEASAINSKNRCLERLMSPECVKQRQEARFIGGSEGLTLPLLVPASAV